MKKLLRIRCEPSFWGRSILYTCILSLLIFLPCFSFAWFTKADRGRCGGKSLSIEVSQTEGAFSHYYNPAYIPIPQQISFSNVIYFEDMYMGKFEETAIGFTGETVYLGTWTPFDLIFKTSYSFKGIGIAGKFIYEQIYYKPEGQGWALAFDVGVKKKIGKLDLTLVGRNLGTKIYYGSGNEEVLPLEFCQGIRYNLYDVLFLSGELREPIDNDIYFCVNSELNISLLSAMVGYNQNLDVLSLGCKVKLFDVDLSYSIQLLHPLSSTHRISLAVKL